VGHYHVTLHWYDGDESFASALLSAAGDALDRLADDAGATLEVPVSAYVYATSQELRTAILFPPDWMGGAAFSDHGTIAIAATRGSMDLGKRFLTHELAHLVTYQMTVNPYSEIPRWLDEGLSTYAEGDLRFDLSGPFETAISNGTLLSIQTISSNFPSDINQARLSYAESYSVFQFLIQEYGADNMLMLLDVFKRGATYDEALAQAYGFNTRGLDNLWRASLGLQPRPSPSVTAARPTETPDSSLFGCQASPNATAAQNATVFPFLGLLSLPAAAEILHHRRHRRRPR
jgi:hypothetical protein